MLMVNSERIAGRWRGYGTRIRYAVAARRATLLRLSVGRRFGVGSSSRCYRARALRPFCGLLERRIFVCRSLRLSAGKADYPVRWAEQPSTNALRIVRSDHKQCDENSEREPYSRDIKQR